MPEQMLPVLADPADRRRTGRWADLRERIGMERLRAVLAHRPPPACREITDTWRCWHSSYGYLRQFTPQVLAAIDLRRRPAASGAAGGGGHAAVAQRHRRPQRPRRGSDGFVPARWRGYLDDALDAGDATAYRHYWELCVLFVLRDGLRTGDVYVPGSRRYADPAAYLLTREPGRRSALSSASWSASPPTATMRLARAGDELDTARGRAGARCWHTVRGRCGSTRTATWSSRPLTGRGRPGRGRRAEG